MSDDEVEAVASAFYAVEYSDSGGDWDHAPEVLKDAFRMDARLAIACCQEDYVRSDPFDLYRQSFSLEAPKYLH